MQMRVHTLITYWHIAHYNLWYKGVKGGGPAYGLSFGLVRDGSSEIALDLSKGEVHTLHTFRTDQPILSASSCLPHRQRHNADLVIDQMSTLSFHQKYK